MTARISPAPGTDRRAAGIAPALAAAALLGVGLALAVAPAVRADVFVPADPVGLERAQCAAVDRDVLAVDDGSTIRVRVGDGPFSNLDGTFGCPIVAAAADGTAAVLDSDGRLARRQPGGAFSAPVSLAGEDTRAQGVAMAVAPGGWIVASWVQDETLSARIFRPDGSSATTVLDKGDLLSAGPIGIDSAGTATLIWQHYESRRTRTRVARFATNSRVTVSEIPGTGADGVGMVDLAVAPAGGTLLAWADEAGVRALVDGGAPAVLDAASPSVDALAVSRADDGTALVSYLRGDDELVTVRRIGGGPWQAPQVLWSGAQRFASSGSGSDSRSVRTMVAPDGRGAVVWTAPVDDDSQLFGAVTQAGGTWGPASRLSSIARASYVTSFAPDAAGLPRVLWSESEHGVRGATVAPARLDVTPPSVTVHFPARLPRTRSARLRFSVRVRCSEACDTRLSIAQPEDAEAFDEGDFVRIARAIAPGRTEGIRVRIPKETARELLRDPKARSLRLRLVVTDRAGNLVRRSATLRVRVIEKPIRALKVAADHDFGMKTTAGNRLVARLVNDLIDRAAHGGSSEEAVHRRYTSGIAAIRRAGHREVTRARVRSRIYAALDVALTRAGLDTGFVLS